MGPVAGAEAEAGLRHPHRRRGGHLRRLGGAGPVLGPAALANPRAGHDLDRGRRHHALHRGHGHLSGDRRHAGPDPHPDRGVPGRHHPRRGPGGGAGYGVSKETGDTATIVKLFRVALLLPTIVVVALMFRSKMTAGPSGKRPPLVPMFLLGFVALVAVNSSGSWPPT
uniref:Sulfate exporter family transporter n=1 Tax=Phenylobacterium glaciei TaxID=2803784 RepID=A0A974SAM5_9CAUL|nr:putative sulfate exporter family transporter [Phenylobacterium glaciei]